MTAGIPQGCGARDPTASADLEERLILVDSRDRIRGLGASWRYIGLVCSTGPFPFSFSMTRSACCCSAGPMAKYHFARLWSNSCCGHPRPEEETPQAAERRLVEEFGFAVSLEPVTQLTYRAGDPVTGLVEHEYLHVFRGRYAGEPRPNPTEVSDWRWVAPARIHRLLRRRPQLFTPWFALLFQRLY